MKLSFVAITSTDKLELPGLLYEPDQPTKKVAVWLHGMGDNGVFYKPEAINTLAQTLTNHNIALLAFNNRGAHHRKHLHIVDDSLPEEDQTFRGGTFYERIAESVYDIDGAVAYLKQQGFSELYLIGHSTGANKICVYHARTKASPFSKYVLSGPGDDSGIMFSELGEKPFKQALARAKKLVKLDKGLKTMPKYSGVYPFSAQAAADIMNPDGDYNTFPYYEATTKRLGTKPLFNEYKTIDKPLLVIMGANDEYAYTGGGTPGVLKLLEKYTNKDIARQSNFMIIAGADHSFHGHQIEFAQAIATWLTRS